MYAYNSPNMDLWVLLDPGIYVFESKSSTGKTYLSTLLKRIRPWDEPVDSITYEDTLMYKSLRDYIDRQDYTLDEMKVILLDRYDLYKGKFVDEINSIKDSCIVLIDCMNRVNIGLNYKICTIEFKGMSEIEIWV